MASVFISYRGADVQPAERLAQALRDAGHEVFFAEWGIDVGDSIVARVDAGLQAAGYLALCLSSAGSSDWLKREWMSALSRQLSGKGVKVLPVYLTGRERPALLADIKCADLVADWDGGAAALLRAIR